MAHDRVKLGIWIGVVFVLLCGVLCCAAGWAIHTWMDGLAEEEQQIRVAATSLLPALRPEGAEFASEDALAQRMEQRAADVDTAGFAVFLAIRRPDGTLRVVRDDGVTKIHREQFVAFVEQPAMTTAEGPVITPFHGQGRVWFGEVTVGGEPHRALVAIQTAD